MRVILSIALVLSFCLLSFAQDQQQQPPPKKKTVTLDMNDFKAAPKEEDPPAEETKETDDKDKGGDKEKTVKDQPLAEAEAALLAHKSFVSTVGGQTLSTFINHRNNTLKDDQKFLLREKLPRDLADVQERLKKARSLWDEYFTLWGKEINADVNKNYILQAEYLDKMKSCETQVKNNIELSEGAIKQYKDKKKKEKESKESNETK